jgi:hypothetical protein
MKEGAGLGSALGIGEGTQVMRIVIIAFAFAALAGVGLVAPANAGKSKMGCEIGKEVWDASAGKCVAGQPKWKSSGKTAKKASSNK